MKQSEFLETLQYKLPPSLRGQPYNDYRAIERQSPRDNYSPEDYLVAHEFIKRLAISQPPAFASNFKTNKKLIRRNQILPHKFGPADALTSEILIEKITSWAEGLRKKLFNSPKPPFDWDGSIKWIEEEVQSKKRRVPKSLQNDLGRLATKLRLYNIRLSPERDLLPFARKGDPWRHSVPVCGPRLENLERETRSVAKATGFYQASLVMFVLAGIKPLVPRIKILDSQSSSTLPTGEIIAGKEISLTFRAYDFSGRELQRLYEQVKRDLKIKRATSFKEKHFRIYSLVRSLGIPLAKNEPGHFGFWERASLKWNQKYRDAPRSWQGLRGAYERLIKNLPSP
ncbi:MAG: hypothetical protein WCB96_13000 [Candidatus Aminicenantales bacterium]